MKSLTLISFLVATSIASASSFDGHQVEFSQIDTQNGKITETTASVRLLNDYAKTVLEILELPVADEDAGITGKRIHIIEDQCFDPASSVRKRGIQTEMKFNAVRKQIESAGLFLKKFKSVPFSIFNIDSIGVCVKKIRGPRYMFNDGEFRINVSNRKITYSVRDRDLLLEDWKNAKHLDKASAERKLWPLFNPIGMVRSGVRRSLKRLAVEFLERSNDGEGGADGTVSKTKLKELVDRFLPGRGELSVEIGGLTDGQRTEFLQKWREFLSDSTNLDDAEAESKRQLINAVVNDITKLNVKQIGLVNVQNFHKIKVNVKATRGNWDQFIEVVTDQSDLNIEQMGLVNVQTNDIITVDANMTSAVADSIDLHRAAASWALNSIKNSDRR